MNSIMKQHLGILQLSKHQSTKSSLKKKAKAKTHTINPPKNNKKNPKKTKATHKHHPFPNKKQIHLKTVLCISLSNFWKIALP